MGEKELWKHLLVVQCSHSRASDRIWERFGTKNAERCVDYVETHWIVRKFQQLTKLMIKPEQSGMRSTSKCYPQLNVFFDMFDLFMVFVDMRFLIYTVFP